MAGQIEEVYGQAMLEAARERGKTEILKTEAEILEQVLEQSGELGRFLGHPAVGTEEKMDLLVQVFPGSGWGCFSWFWKRADRTGFLALSVNLDRRQRGRQGSRGFWWRAPGNWM